MKEEKVNDGTITTRGECAYATEDAAYTDTDAFRIDSKPEPNCELVFGGGNLVTLYYYLPKTIANRIKTKLLCWLLPFKLVRWN